MCARARARAYVCVYMRARSARVRVRALHSPSIMGSYERELTVTIFIENTFKPFEENDMAESTKCVHVHSCARVRARARARVCVCVENRANSVCYILCTFTRSFRL